MILALFLLVALVVALAVVLAFTDTGRALRRDLARSARERYDRARRSPAPNPLYETPAYLYPSALVADGDGGDAPEFVLPEDLTAAEVTAEYDDEGNLVGGTLHELETQAVEAFDAIRAGDMNAEDLEHLAQLADAVDAIRAESTRRLAAAGEAAAQAQALADRVHPAASAEGDGDGEGEGGDDDDEGGDGGGDEPAGAGDGEGAASDADQPEPVLAGGTPRGAGGPIRVPLGRIRDRARGPEVQPVAGGLPDGMTITAAADVPGVPNGGRIPDTGVLAGLLHGRARGLSEGGSALVASIEYDLPVVVDEAASKATMRDAIEAARDVPGVLVAAGGWCAPSDRMWDFFSVESNGGLLDLPTIGIQRGGLEFPVSPSIGDVFDVPWLWTEADDEAALGNPHEDPDDDRVKPCFRIPCGTWDEVRLRAHGVCLTHGNLSDKAWPEQTRRYVDLTMSAHAHVMNARNLARLVALSQAVTIGTTNNATASILNAIELQVMDYRDKYRMSDSVILEGVFDAWNLGLIRADLARRSGVNPDEAHNITNADIAGWFQARGVRPQFVHDFHPLQTGQTGVDGFRETWPTSVTFLLYAAGTFVRGTGAKIDLGVVRDSTLNATNDHTAAWTEEADLVAKVGHESRVVTATVTPNGVTSAPATAPTAPLA